MTASIADRESQLYTFCVELEAPVDITRVDPVDDDDVDADVSQVGEASWLRRGATISRYVIVECLGVGGMGIVYAAWDPKLDRKLAIKLVRARLGSSGGTRGRNRLMREAQALACVRHPNVVTVHDVGAVEGRVFVVMEFIEGTTLQQWLEQERERPFTELLDVFLQAGRGLAAAHRAGLVHRDFKPENVMIGNDGRVVVLDFGIARGPTLIEEPANSGAPTKLADDDESEDAGDVEDVEDVSEPEDPEDLELTPLEVPSEMAPSELVEDGMTRPGAIVGTPSYMSPEQRRRRPLDRRSDQFSYCVALWEALSGERPFGEGVAQKLLARMRLGQFRPMRRRDVPRRVIQALHRGLAWDRNDRFSNMETLLEALNPRTRGLGRLPLALAGAALTIVVAGAGMIVGSGMSSVSALDHESPSLVDSVHARALLQLGRDLERQGANAEAERVLLAASRAATNAREFAIAAEAIEALAGLLAARGLQDEALRWLELAEGLGSPAGLRARATDSGANE